MGKDHSGLSAAPRLFMATENVGNRPRYGATRPKKSATWPHRWDRKLVTSHG